MDTDGLIDALGYRDTQSFLEAPRWHETPEHAHVFRHSAAACAGPRVRGRFRGVYMLGIGIGRTRGRGASTPVVYICEADDAAAADEIHRLAWNQSAAPFVMVRTPVGVRLYSGFDYEPAHTQGPSTSQRGVLDACVAFEHIHSRLAAFHAERIDDGTLWAEWGQHVQPAHRVDARLLSNLENLGRWLHDSSGLDHMTAHALVGRFVYLRYLWDRGILTNARLQSWGLEPERAFGRKIQLSSFYRLIDAVDAWLNGSIFPLPRSGKRAPKHADVQRVAGLMLGDEVDTGQYHLDFSPYDFSHIPIELLSSIYEQFMASERSSSGAFYTPLPLVNFVLGELDDLCPLQVGMRVFDPSCGSGAFLVQCYQLLVERRRNELAAHPSPRELRKLLTDHIFGVDREEGACRVTEFSLALALLDQIPTKILARAHNFKLPHLRDHNIFVGDFFDPQGPWSSMIRDFDWIVGNPPWFKSDPKQEDHQLGLEWMRAHKKTHPVCGNQVAEAFAWKATSHLNERPSGVVAFVMPALTLFSKQRDFREHFLSAVDVKAVANLANLRRVLFGGRATHPAVVLFYGHPTPDSSDEIYVYSPMVANQEANRPVGKDRQKRVWTITVNHSEVRVVSREGVAGGDTLPWKISMWGSARDLRLLQNIARRFPPLRDLERQQRLLISEGPQLRERRSDGEVLDPLPEVVGQLELDAKPLKNQHRVHSFPEHILAPVAEARGFVRQGRGQQPLSVCYPPHVVVSASRRFAVYSDQFLVIPPRTTIGIGLGAAAQAEDDDLLRALALYLGSCFVQYHQFFISPQQGIRSGRATLRDLEALPIPFLDPKRGALRPWAKLQRRLATLSAKRWAVLDRPSSAKRDRALEQTEAKLVELEGEVDDLTARALGLRPQERWLIDDLVHVRLHLLDGKVGELAVAPPTPAQIVEYAQALRDTLDVFLDRGDGYRHIVTVVQGPRGGVVQIAFERRTTPHEVRVLDAEDAVSQAIAVVRQRIESADNQWLYFDRNLTLYFDEKVFICKPRQRLWWTRSRALADADRVIADLVSSGVKP